MIQTTLKTFDETKIAQEGQPPQEFRKNASYSWTIFRENIILQNKMSAEINASEKNFVLISKQMQNANNAFVNIKKDIDKKHEEVMSKVIPTGSTYNPEKIEQVVNNAQILVMAGAI